MKTIAWMTTSAAATAGTIFLGGPWWLAIAMGVVAAFTTDLVTGNRL